MVFSGMDLPNRSADSRTILAHYHEQVLSHKSQPFVGLHNLNVREALAICADFILALCD